MVQSMMKGLNLAPFSVMMTYKRVRRDIQYAQTKQLSLNVACICILTKEQK